MKFKDCPDSAFIRYKTDPGAPRTNKELAYLLMSKGYTDADEHKVRRRSQELRRRGLLRDRLVSPEARSRVDPDDIT